MSAKTATAKKPSWYAGLAGTLPSYTPGEEGTYRFFNAIPGFVDIKNAPGESKISLDSMSVMGMVKDLATLKVLVYTPNLVWLLITAVMYVVAPYDLSPDGYSAEGPLTLSFFKHRFPLWTAMIFAYYAFFHVSFYFMNFAKRPMLEGRQYRISRLLHNLLYCATGTFIWVALENAICFLWATGRLPYLTDEAAFSTPSGFALFVAGICLVPQFRDGHFYFVHRYIHFRPLYNSIHSLHHRNTDVEPFSGFCMHPMEHLFYFMSVLPSIFLFLSPSSMLFNSVHLLLAPAASHSGYEDHWQADNWHYFHHRYFEVNYGGAYSAMFDVVFGSACYTWREALPIKPRADAKASIMAPPTRSNTIYMAGTFMCLGLYAVFAAGYSAQLLALLPAKKAAVLTALLTPKAVALIASFGPVVLSLTMGVLSDGVGVLIKPFDKRPLLETVMHFAVGTMCGAYPAYVLGRAALE